MSFSSLIFAIREIIESVIKVSERMVLILFDIRIFIMVE